MIHFYGDIGEIKRMAKGIDIAEEALKKAEVSALNKTITQVRTFIAREVAKEYTVSQGNVRKELKLVKASYNRLESQVIGSGSPGIPLYQFRPTPKRVPSTKRLKSGGYSPRGGVSVMIRKGSRKPVKGAFIARMASGHVGVFRRTGSGRGNWWSQTGDRSIEELYGPSPLRIIDSDRYYQKLDEFTEVTIDKHREHEAQFYLNKAGVPLV